MKIKQIADRIGKHENTIRNWAKQFAEFLSPAPVKGEHRNFIDEDLRRLSHISQLSDIGMSYEDIRLSIKQKVDEGSPFAPVLPTASASDVQGLITQTDMEARLTHKDAEIRELNVRLEEVRKRLNEEIMRQTEKDERHMQQMGRLYEEIGRLKMQLESSKKS